MIYQSWVVRRELPLIKYIKDSLPFLIKSIIMLFVVIILGRYIKNEILRIITQVIIAGLIYGILNFKYIYSNIDFNNFLNRTKKEGQ